jgi:hypothetical protein
MGKGQRCLEVWKGIDKQEEGEDAAHRDSIDVYGFAEHVVKDLDSRRNGHGVRT